MISTALLTTTQKRGKVSTAVGSLAQIARSHGPVTITCADEADLTNAAQYLCGHIEMPSSLYQAVRPLHEASILGIVTPVHQGSMSGMVKTMIDLMQCQSLTKTTTMAVAISGSEKHRGVLDYSLSPVLQSLGASHCIPSISIGPSDWANGQLHVECTDRLRRRMAQAHEIAQLTQTNSTKEFSTIPQTLQQAASS